jgi:hypothetical protein
MWKGANNLFKFVGDQAAQAAYVHNAYETATAYATQLQDAKKTRDGAYFEFLLMCMGFSQGPDQWQYSTVWRIPAYISWQYLGYQ